MRGTQERAKQCKTCFPLCVAIAENEREREKDQMHPNNQKLLSAGPHEGSVPESMETALLQAEELRVSSLFVSHKGIYQQGSITSG